MVERRIVRRAGAAILTRPGERTTRAAGAAAPLALEGRAADRQAVGRVDLDQAGRVHDLGGGVVGHDGVDHRTRFFVVLEGDEYVGHRVSLWAGFRARG